MRTKSFSGVPSTYAILAAKTDFLENPTPSLRYLTQAGGAMSPALTRRIREALPDAVEISARTGSGLDRLAEAVAAAAADGTVACAIRVAIGNGRAQAWVRERFTVEEETVDEEAIRFRGRGHPADLARLEAMGGEIL